MADFTVKSSNLNIINRNEAINVHRQMCCITYYKSHNGQEPKPLCCHPS